MSTPDKRSLGERFGIQGCNDSSCYIAPPPNGSMHTNAGCRCSPSKFWRIIQRLEAAPSAIVPNALGTMPDNAQNIGQLNRPYEIAKQALLEQAREIAGLRASLSNDALHAWAMCEKARADAFKECAEIVESMSGVEEGRSDHATSDAAWAAIKLQDAAEKIRERAAKTNHITHALGAPTDGSIAK